MAENIFQTAVSKVKQKAAEILRPVQQATQNQTGFIQQGKFVPTYVQQTPFGQSVKRLAATPVAIPKPLVPILDFGGKVGRLGEKAGEGVIETATFGLVDVPIAPSTTRAEQIVYGIGSGLGLAVNPFSRPLKALETIGAGLTTRGIARFAPQAPRIIAKTLPAVGAEALQTGGILGGQQIAQQIGLRPEQEITAGTFAEQLGTGLTLRGAFNARNILRGIRAPEMGIKEIPGQKGLFEKAPEVQAPTPAKPLVPQAISKKGETISMAKAIAQEKPPAPPAQKPPVKLTAAGPGKTRQLGFITTVEQSLATKPQTIEEIDRRRASLMVDQKAMRKTVEEAENIAKNLTDEGIMDRIRTGVDPEDVRTALGVIRGQRKQAEAGKRVKELMKQGMTQEAAEEIAYQPVVDSLEEVARVGLEQGRGINMFRLWNQMTPMAMLKAAKRAIDKANNELLPVLGKPLSKKFIDDLNREIIKRHNNIQKYKDFAKRDEETKKLFKYIANKIPPSFREKVGAYVYQNMLSGLQTQGRNIHGNAVLGALTRPIDIAFQAMLEQFRPTGPGKQKAVTYGDFARYLQQFFSPKSWSEAFDTGKKIFKKEISFNPMDTQTGDTIIQKYREQNIPDLLTFVSRFMSGADGFFNTLITKGEIPRFTRLGLDEQQAVASAKQVAEEYTLRRKIGEKRVSDSFFATVIDDIASQTLDLRKKKTLSLVTKAMLPFVTTPANFGKAMVDRSILGFIPPSGFEGQISNERLAKAMSGTLALGIGGLFAFGNRVVLAAPKEEKARQAFYDSGKKEFSVLVNGTYIPLAYFGPYSLSLAIPEMIKQAATENPELVDKNILEKGAYIGQNIIKYIGSQSSLAQAATFYQLISGERAPTVNAGNFLGFSAGQLIPLQGFLRTMTEWFDPTYRKADNFIDAMKRDIPLLSKQLPALENYNRLPAQRLGVNRLNILPYDVGVVDQDMQQVFENIQQRQMVEAKIKALEKEAKKAAVQPPAPGVGAVTPPPVTPPEVTTGITPPPAPTGGDTLTNVLAKKEEERKKFDDINRVLQSVPDVARQQQIISELGHSADDVQNAQYYKMKNLSLEDKVMVIQSIPNPDYKALYDKEVLTLPVAKELQKAGVIPDAQALINSLKERDIVTPITEPVSTGLPELDKINQADYTRALNARINDIVGLYNGGQIDANTAESLIKGLQIQKDVAKQKRSRLTPKKPRKITVPKVKLKAVKVPKAKAIKLQTIKPVRFARLKQPKTSRRAKLKTIKVRA